MCVCRVDLDEFPSLRKIPWFEATVEKGDCIYIPYLWLHQVCRMGVFSEMTSLSGSFLC